ncbi:hypothetical protein [Pseudodesulfovibrio senegalensis]|jgi:hypothetical protein|uniref:Uncharacterized protein n=1 Tax=Pseudodesulfovibrio senegalensis TaxID=1721087 RepID=A0A6N6N1L2_9BACT|nr:hypothetical protein [Pseudodesulfovibrio senegalensis]KAB1440784.1 hypothetical protein F8A88_12595 [Pseudodesulfovibrio senegalensis]
MAQNTNDTPPRKRAVRIRPRGVRIRKEPPRYDAVAASSRFVSSMFWILVLGLLFNIGQAVRWYNHSAQLAKIERELYGQYHSVLGEDVGAAPFGRLQFEHDKLAAVRPTGLDPLAVTAALSAHADAMVRVDAVKLGRKVGQIRGLYMPDPAAFDEFIKRLERDDTYFFELQDHSDVFGGIGFQLRVERK